MQSPTSISSNRPVDFRRRRRVAIVFGVLVVALLLVGVILVAITSVPASSQRVSSIGDGQDPSITPQPSSQENPSLTPVPFATVAPSIPSQSAASAAPSPTTKSVAPSASFVSPTGVSRTPSPVVPFPSTRSPSSLTSQPSSDRSSSPTISPLFTTATSTPIPSFRTTFPSATPLRPQRASWTPSPVVPFPSALQPGRLTPMPKSGPGSLPTVLPSESAAPPTKSPNADTAVPVPIALHPQPTFLPVAPFPLPLPTYPVAFLTPSPMGSFSTLQPSTETVAPSIPAITVQPSDVSLLPTQTTTKTLETSVPTVSPTEVHLKIQPVGATLFPTETSLTILPTVGTQTPTAAVETSFTAQPSSSTEMPSLSQTTAVDSESPTSWPTVLRTPLSTIALSSSPTATMPSLSPFYKPDTTLIPTALLMTVPTAVPRVSDAGHERPTGDNPSPRSPAPSFDPQGGTMSALLGEGVSYRPGHLTVHENGLLLSEGLKSRIIAKAGEKVQDDYGRTSILEFHKRPDGAAVFSFPSLDPLNPGGWVYVSNSEIEHNNEGGVGAIYFDRFGNVTAYTMLLSGTTMNCNGGHTPWDTWVTCEEVPGKGQVYQVDPFGRRPPQKTVIGDSGGQFEAFAFDDRNRTALRFFVSEDSSRGALRRFTPIIANWADPWSMLHGDGTLEFLVLQPNSVDNSTGTFYWTTNHDESEINTREYYPYSEGLDRDKNILYMVCKKVKWMFMINLDDFTYERYSTEHGVFDGKPDQINRILGSDQDILYFSEEHGSTNGIHGRNSAGQFFTVLETPGYRSETTGLSFSPDATRMYFAGQEDGIVFEVTRTDGHPFDGKTLNIHYHNQATGPSR